MMFRTTLYEFIAFPAHCWLYVTAWLCGGKFTCGPVTDDDDNNDEKLG